jgi:hypothetical protein
MVRNFSVQGPRYTKSKKTKKNRWKAILDLSVNPGYTNLRAAVWFEESKPEESYFDAQARVNKDYRITENPAVRQAFQTDLNAAGEHIKYAENFAYSCDGTIQLKN